MKSVLSPKENLSTLVNHFCAQTTDVLPIPELHNGYRVIDVVGTTAITTAKFFGSHNLPNAGLGYCASKQLHYTECKTTTIISLTVVIEDFIISSAALHDAPYSEALSQTQTSGVYLSDKGVRIVTHRRSNIV